MKRDIWSKLEEWKGKKERKPLILRGARQVGKTYILKEFCREHFSTFHYANLEKDEQLAKIFEKDLDPKRIIQELSFHLGGSINIDKDVLIFDEVQNVPRALLSLKYFHEDLPDLAICAAGSLLGIHLGVESFPVGKVEFLDMFPLSFEEFLLGVDDRKSFDFIRNFSQGEEIPDIVHAHLWDQLKIYLVVGGLPEIVEVFAEQRDDLYEAMRTVRKKQDDLMLEPFTKP